MGSVLVTGVTGQLGYFVAEHLSRAATRSGDWSASRPPVGRGRRQRFPITRSLAICWTNIRCSRSWKSPAGPDLQLRRAELHPLVLDAADPDRAIHGPRRRAAAGGGAARRPGAGSCRPARASCSRGQTAPQDEEVPIRPLNPYGIAKAFAYHTVRAYRTSTASSRPT